MSVLLILTRPIIEEKCRNHCCLADIHLGGVAPRGTELDEEYEKAAFGDKRIQFDTEFQQSFQKYTGYSPKSIPSDYVFLYKLRDGYGLDPTLNCTVVLND